MADIPDELVEKAARALESDPLVGALGDARKRVARAVLAAVLPDIRRAVAEEIAAAIEAMEPEATWAHTGRTLIGQPDAARIARQVVGDRDGT